MKKFSSIEHFRHVVKTVHNYFNRIGQPEKVPTLHFVGTVKLHGTNAGVRRSTSGKIQPQSKERIIGVDCDNYGFAKFISEIPEDKLNELFDKVSNKGDDVTLFGEWIGKGIQSKAAVSELDPQWVIFGAWVNEEYVENNIAWQAPEISIYNILEVEQFRVTVDFKNPGDSIEDIEKRTLAVEEQCPWAKKFGVEGVGEGIVWRCEERPNDSDLWFKSKGEKHSSKRKSGKNIASVDPQKVESIEKCIDIIVTDGRLEQGLSYLTENNLDHDMKNMGKFLKWVGQDIQKEEMDTIEANGLEWKDVTKEITQRAKRFFMDRVNTF